MSYIIFTIEGGLGKCIFATAVCQAFHEQRPGKKLIVVSGYPDVFLNNPHVHRAFGYGNIQYFYEQYIKDKDSEIYTHNPYGETDFVYNRKHIIEIWCRLFGLEYKKEYLPKIYLTNREIDFYSRRMISEKPFFVIQTNGGADNQVVKYSWARDIPVELAQKVVNYFAPEYHVIHLRREDQFTLENTQSVTAPFRELVVLMSMSKKRLLMDSFAHHLASSLGLPSTVLWIANSPVVFGYEFNDNIIANPFTNKPEIRNSFLQEFNITGEPMEFPYNSEAEIFDLADVVNSLLNEK